MGFIDTITPNNNTSKKAICLFLIDNVLYNEQTTTLYACNLKSYLIYDGCQHFSSYDDKRSWKTIVEKAELKLTSGLFMTTKTKL